MFVDDFCEDWDSTKRQDDFIEKYFGKKKVNSTKASNSLESVDKSRNSDVSKNFISKAVNKHSLNYEEEHIKKRSKENQTLYDSSSKNCSEISQNMESIGALNCESNNFKNKKRKKKLLYRNIAGDLSEQVLNIEDLNDETKAIDHSSENSLKNVNFESAESSSNCQKMKKKKKRKRAKSFSEDESLMPNKLFVKTDIINEIAFSDSSVKDNNASDNYSDSNCSKKKKIKNKLKNDEKHSKTGELSYKRESTSFKNSHDLSAKQNNISETSSTALHNDSLIKENNSNPLKKKRKKNKFKNVEKLDEFSAEEESVNSEITYDPPMKKSGLLQNKAYQKLQAAKFRYLNEMLYTNSGKDSLDYFKQNTDEFLDYHAGYQSQVSKWPINPVDIIIQEISRINKQAVIADLGCGAAKIAEVFPKRTVHSFDLIALKDCVTACDMANVPLPSNSVHVVIFCLSLMGTNWKDYLKEGQRILKLGGMLKIAEIESRIENVQHFIKEIENFGFSFINQDLTHKMFVFLNFKRVSKNKKSSKVPEVTLKPCLYKKR